MTRMTRHERTVLEERLLENYNWLEKTLVSVGLERLVVFLRAQNMERVSVKPAHNVMKDDFPLAGEGLDYD